MFQKNKKGFTLIELMVVIAIIAILATVVLVSLQSARDAAEDTNRISAVGQIRSIAQVYHSTGDLTYSDLPDVGGELDEVTATYGLSTEKDVWNPEGEEGNFLHLRVDDAGESFCASIELNEEGTTPENMYFCVDDSLTGKKVDGNPCSDDNVSCDFPSTP